MDRLEFLQHLGAIGTGAILAPRAWNDKTQPFNGASDLPPLSTNQLQSFHDALDSLNAAIDGLADLLTAEFRSVFEDF